MPFLYALVVAVPLLALTACTDTRSADASRGDDVVHVEGTFTAQDFAAGDPDFVAFRDALRATVARRDTAGLLAVVSDGARLSFGDAPGGPAGVRQMWFEGTTPGEETLWGVLERILGAGSVYEDGAATVPFVYGAWPRDSVDAFSHVAVVGERVPARAEPDTSAATVAVISHAILPVLAPPLGGFWQLRLPDGSAAFVSIRDAMSPVGYRAAFWDEGDGWQMHLLVAGD